ncbi:head assembly [Synechococcus phage S-CBP1]|uniref:Capsid assembly protein (Scaffold) n=1 Tax=Synechococcus phage S-CBP1 TaxID=1273711 RepID=A0A096VKE8_9CAUD|nr:head assembly [Synechococcus phage S-CBP1]AGK86531.1 capsid assembly protein (scaffold) [Synechococcus phage S-CBP1]
MAIELTLNPNDEVEGQLSADEQESLEIGERLAQEEEQLLAGKYRSAEELERGYLELQKRLSGKQEDVEAEPQQQEEEQNEEDTQEETSLYEEIMESYQKGEWDQDLVKQVEGMNPVDVVNLFLENQQAQAGPVATDDDIAQIQQSVGGAEDYTSMIQWASENLSEQEIGMYDAVMDRGDPLAMFFAAQALYGRYQDAVGVDGELLTGTTPRNSADVFRSQAEVVRAMSDPRYDNDPAYRQDVADKLERSNLQF